MPIDELLATVEAWGPATLITVGPDGSPRLVVLYPVVNQSRTAVRFFGPGRTALSNIETRPSVTLFFPDHDQSQGYSLIVDGAAAAVGDGSIEVTPESAVLHRPAPPVEAQR